MWELHRAAPGSAPPPPPPLRFVLFFDSPRASKALALSRHAHSHTRTHERAPAKASRATRARAHPEKEDGGQKRRKKGEGASHKRQLRELGPRAAREEAAAAAAAPTPTSGSICIPALGNWGEQTTGRRAESGSERGRAGAVQPACGGRSRGPSRAQNEPRASERREPKRGLAPGEGVARGKTRIWSARGLHLAARQTLGGGNERAATEVFLSGGTYGRLTFKLTRKDHLTFSETH
ncbi:unnamed protein product [Rangifer tarandus platyrhynchus]|uniref:Uncharacterized protein n=1 Tax=Rangifer tarandus platyrhynchus TaxID=3082113 RepID=A0AC59ZNV6_RANTA